MEEQKQTITKALCLAQGEMMAISKSRNNTHFKSKYAGLDEIIEMARPILTKHGLSVVQMPVFEDGNCGVETVIYHESGENINCGKLLLPLGRGGGAQGAGSSITYARRYAFSAALMISCDEDDDGNGAQASYKQQSAPSVNDNPYPATKEQVDRFKAACEAKGYDVPERCELMTIAQLKKAFEDMEKSQNVQN